jgi:cellulose synthase/poly-beta-1,6-N-acetylglucosamine synthase-like glycosyltransferase
MIALSIILFILLFAPFTYLLLLAFASIKTSQNANPLGQPPKSRFIIAIPAHNEANVIEATIKRILLLNYPTDLYKICVIADHCSDETVDLARQAGAYVFERNSGPRNGKGAAISWFLNEKMEEESTDAVVIFDADTQVDKEFLNVMGCRLERGNKVIQGQHIIRNPNDGWFPALCWAMFLIDNRIQNQGRTNLGWSAKHMGDSICFQANVLRMCGWGAGLTEDYQLRQRLLLEGIKIVYEPDAIGYGEAPQTWHKARAQRARWLKGTQDASHEFASRLLIKGISGLNGALLDGAFQAYLPSYSTLTILSFFFLSVQVLINIFIRPIFPLPLILLWCLYLFLLFCYPFWGLALEHAPLKAYWVILSGPLFILWRSWLALTSRFNGKRITWVRTEHGNTDNKKKG